MASITDLSRSFIVNDVELNSSYIGENQVVGWASASILILFLFAVDEFGNILRIKQSEWLFDFFIRILAVLILQVDGIHPGFHSHRRSSHSW